MILGIDEVGRGPWAGPLVVGAVILGDTFPKEIQLTDSKKLSTKKRNELNALILDQSIAHGLGWISTAELDRNGLSASLKLATRRAVKAILAQITAKTLSDHNPPQPESSSINEIIIDGTINFLQNTPLADRVSILPKADFLIREVSAASIIAKVARDAYMAKIALQYPAYGFEKHVGYGTALHKKALLEYGICPEHRQSFRPIREILEKTAQNPDLRHRNPTFTHQTPPKSAKFSPEPQNTPLRASRNAQKSPTPSTSQKGQTAELAVSSYLQTQNHQIIAHNFKTKTCEIDLISLKNSQIFFTEVKYSQSLTREGTPLVRITPEKQAQMHYAAEFFIKAHPEFQTFSPILAAASVSGPDYQVEDWLILS